MVLFALTLNVVDVGTDIVLCVQFIAMGLYVFFGLSVAFVTFPLLCNVVFRGYVWIIDDPDSDALFEGIPGGTSIKGFFMMVVLNVLQLQVYLDASVSISKGSKTSSMTLTKTTESLFESFPSSGLQLYAALCCLHAEGWDRLFLACSIGIGALSVAYSVVLLDVQVICSNAPVPVSLKVWRMFFRTSEIITRLFSVCLVLYSLRPDNMNVNEGSFPWVPAALAVEFVVIIIIVISHSIIDEGASSGFRVMQVLVVAIPLMVVTLPSSGANRNPRLAAQTLVVRCVFTIACLTVSAIFVWRSHGHSDFLSHHAEYPGAVTVAFFAAFAMHLHDALRSPGYQLLTIHSEQMDELDF